MKKRSWLFSATLLLVILFFGFWYYAEQVANPKVVDEIINKPNSDRAALVTLIELPSGRSVPANYRQEGKLVFIGVDGRWWREFETGPQEVQLLVRGEILKGSAVVVLDNPSYTKEVFARLRPNAPKWLPAWLNGKLIVITVHDTLPMNESTKGE